MPVSTTFGPDQIGILVLLAGMLVVFAFDRFRIEMVAVAGLAIGFGLGLVPAGHVFDGFSNTAVITVVEILMIVQVLRRVSVLDAAARRIARLDLSEPGLILGLCAASAFISVFMNNIGALALMLPVVATISDVTGIDSRKTLIPVSYATLLGGMCSLIGTPANLLVSQALVSAGGPPIGFFDFAIAGLPMTIAGLAVIVLWIPGRFRGEDRRGTAGARRGRTVLAEVVIPSGSPLDGLFLSDMDRSYCVAGHSVLRDGKHVFARPSEIVLASGDLLVVSGELAAIDALIGTGTLDAARSSPPGATRQEIVVLPESTLVGSRLGAVELLERFGVRVAAASIRSPRIEGGLADLQLSVGDVLVLEGRPDALAHVVEETDTLQLVPSAQPRKGRHTVVAPLAFAFGIVLAAFGPVPPELAFGGVLLVLVLLGQADLRSALADLNWPIIVMLAAMIPLGSAVETTGAAATLSAVLVSLLPHAGIVLLAAVFLLAVLVTPFVNNASTAIVLAPIAIEIARSAGLPPEPFLIAVAAGASTDFLTPFGHHNNTLVMTVGGYRFSDFVRCGWPVTLAAVSVGVICLSVGGLF